jgi:hypothetical protein
MADWSSRQLIEAKFYEDQLDLRKRRMHEVTHATKESYIGVLKAKRRRWAAHARA